ncbi:hypothetical protein ACO0QE_001195 [Hanseniaspora vineae]
MFTPTKGNSNGKHPLSLLLGSNVTEWPYDNLSLCKALELRSQQEVTKQHFYKLELLKLSVQAKIPGDLIPSIFSTSTNANGLPKSADLLQNFNTNSQEPAGTSPFKDLPDPNSNVIMINPNQKIKLQNFKFPPETSGSSSPVSASRNTSPDAKIASGSLFDSASTTDSTISNNFRRSHKRTESPARIGAEAVKALNGNHTMTLTEEPEIQQSPTVRRKQVQFVSKGVFINNQHNASENEVELIEKPVFQKTHRRIQSLPSVLKPSPFSPELFSFKTNFKSSDTRSTLSSEDSKKTLPGASKRPHRDVHNTKMIDLDAASSTGDYQVNKKFKFGLPTGTNVQTEKTSANDKNRISSVSTQDTSDEDEYEGNLTNSNDSDTTIEEDCELTDSKSFVEQQPEKPVFVHEQSTEKAPESGNFVRAHRRANTLDSILN